MSCSVNAAKRPGRPRAGISFSEAMARTTHEMRLQRLLWPSARYREAFSARVRALMGVIRVQSAEPSGNSEQFGVNRAVFSPEPRVMRNRHPGEPR
jgi:hypothetical protein